MQNHLAAFHGINPCIDPSGYSRAFKSSSRASMSESTSTTAAAASTPMTEDERLQAALAMSREHAGVSRSIEDEILAQVLSMTATEFKTAEPTQTSAPVVSRPLVAPTPVRSSLAPSEPSSRAYSPMQDVETFGHDASDPICMHSVFLPLTLSRP